MYCYPQAAISSEGGGLNYFTMSLLTEYANKISTLVTTNLFSIQKCFYTLATYRMDMYLMLILLLKGLSHEDNLCPYAILGCC